jgi:phosphoribosylamine--glycine ligase
MPLLETSAKDLFYKAAIGRLNELDLKFKDEFAVGVVVASKDYPYKNSEPKPIAAEDGNSINSHVAYAGVSKKDGVIYASGGRVLVCVGIGKSIKEARDNAYDLTKNISFEGAKFRNDIAYQALK